MVCLAGLVLISIPFLSNAAEGAATNSTTQWSSLTPLGVLSMSTLTNAFSLTNGMVASFSFEYTADQATALITNSQVMVSLIGVRCERPGSDFGEFVIRHMTPDQEYRFVSCNTDSSRVRKALASVSAGYGEFFSEDDTELCRGSNGAKRDWPGFLYVRTRFEF